MNISDEIKQYRNQFSNLYHQSIKPSFEVYESSRKLKLTKLIAKSTALLIVLFFLFFIYFTNLTNDYINILQLIILCTLIALIVVWFFTCDSFSKDLKNMFLGKILWTLGNIRWKPLNSQISDNELRNSELFCEELSSITDDYFEGNYKGIRFKISELLLSTEGGKNIFKGIVLLFNSNKNIISKTIIAGKNDKSIRKKSNPYYLHIIFSILMIPLSIICFKAQFHFFGLWCLFFIGLLINDYIQRHKQNSKIIQYENMQKITLEDPEFNKKYIAYSSSQVEGRYLITPAFMERFKNLQTTFGTNKVKCAFFEDKIMFAISTRKNLFEIGNIFTPLTDSATLQNFYNEIIAIYLMIDYFKLNENTKL